MCKVLTVSMRDKSFVVDFERRVLSTFNAKVDDQSQIWHKKLGHFYNTTLKFMHIHNIFDDLSTVN